MRDGSRCHTRTGPGFASWDSARLLKLLSWRDARTIRLSTSQQWASERSVVGCGWLQQSVLYRTKMDPLARFKKAEE